MGIGGDQQLAGLLYACGVGFWLGLYYELFRTVRLLLPPTAKSCFFQDVFFCLSAALVTFFCFLAIADGELYPYLFIGELAGFFACYCTVGRLLHRLLAVLLRRLYRMGRWVWERLLRPVHAASGFFARKSSEIRAVIRKKTAILRKKTNFFQKKS